MTQVTLMTGPERRRRWSDQEQREILAAAFSPGAVVSDVSRRFDVSTSLIYKWRRQLVEARAASSFVPAVMIDEVAPPDRAAGPEPAIVVELAGGTRVKIGTDASSSAISATLRALR
jgi:transposase